MNLSNNQSFYLWTGLCPIPQMSPMNWLMLYTLFSVTLITSMSKAHFTLNE